MTLGKERGLCIPMIRPASTTAELVDHAALQPMGRMRLSSRTGIQLWMCTVSLSSSIPQHLRDHASEEYRDTMVENVPLHRDGVGRAGRRSAYCFFVYSFVLTRPNLTAKNSKS